jgi:phosphopantothenoylcysteine decarboxylase / phosphopantothenate---cysteine ligase
VSTTPSKAAPHVVLGVSGGIAAYKAVDVLRRLRDAGVYVSPVLTPDATKFVGAVTFSALASEPARTQIYGDPSTPIPHTYLGQHADLIVIVPTTAHVIARLAMGVADDLLTLTVLASRAPVVLFPAMHTEMWEQPSVQENLATLRRRGVLVVEPEVGPLAGGDVGAGRLPEPATIADTVLALLAADGTGPLGGRSVLVTAGGTREPIDPVRVLTNRSSGRQGYAFAEVAARLGATVTLVTAASLEVALDVRRRVTVVPCTSAAEMAETVLTLAPSVDVVVMAAAVADFTVDAAPGKLKKEDGVPVLSLRPTTDILATLGATKPSRQVLVGFAAETSNVLANGRAKMARKNCDLLVVNDVSAPEVGFDYPTNEVHLLDRAGGEVLISLRSKEGVAEAVLSKVGQLLQEGMA